MAPQSYTLVNFDTKRQDEAWTRVAEFGSVAAANSYVMSPAVHWTQGKGTQAALSTTMSQASAFARAIGDTPDKVLVALDRKDRDGYLSLLNLTNSTVQVWTFQVEAADPLSCFQRMANLAQGPRTDCKLRLVAQEDRAFMWKAPLVHPMQARENVFQRVVHAAGRNPGDTDALTAQSEALARFFQQNEGSPTPMEGVPARPSDDEHWAAVRMNHLIETFYLFRLLVRYEVSAAGPIEDALRVDLSGALTKLLHNGDRTRMGWLSEWLTAKVADLGTRVQALNPSGKKKAIFFLKGGRALNYYLGTPEKGENDWDTQVVIDPSLPAEEWYQVFSQVHDTLLAALEEYNEEFAELVTSNVAAFDDYLQSIEGPAPVEDEEVDENELSDVESRHGRASCKAELIDIGLPRRDTPSALEEWTHLSPDGAILSVGGVNFPHRPYYVNEYLMMVRDAFLPDADVHKAPKRVARFSLLLQTPHDGDDSADERRRLQALPQTMAAIDAVEIAAHQELFTTIAAQFAQAYSLPQDMELAGIFDGWATEMIKNPPALSDHLKEALGKLTDQERSLAGAVGVAHALSEQMIRHWKLRSTFVLGNAPLFDGLLLSLRTRIEPLLAEVGAQFAVVGSYAAQLHAGQLRLGAEGLEPVRRIVVHLQHPDKVAESTVMGKVRDAVLEVVAASGRLEPIPLGPSQDPKQRTVSFRWNEDVKFDDGLAYRPLVLKLRAAAQVGTALPVLASIRGLPVLDMRFLANDYLRKSAKIDETGMRKILGGASQAIVEMMSSFDVSTVMESDPDDES
jgi:hypothetical protein